MEPVYLEERGQTLGPGQKRRSPPSERAGAASGGHPLTNIDVLPKSNVWQPNVPVAAPRHKAKETLIAARGAPRVAPSILEQKNLHLYM